MTHALIGRKQTAEHVAKRIRVKHGAARRTGRKRLYKLWCAIKSRCLNPTATGWAKYGARGITICDKWRDSFQVFVNDLPPEPATGKWSMDRIDNARGYEPGNVRWATGTMQARNTRRTKFVVVDGVSRPMRDLAEETGLQYGTVLNRLASGWPETIAVSAPPDSRVGRRSHWLEWQGRTLLVTDWARELGVNDQTLFERLKRGWSIERTLTAPVQRKRQ